MLGLVERSARAGVDLGSARSATSTSPAATVLVVVPTALSDSVRERHAEEIAALGGAETHLIAADQAALDALGSNPLDPAHREPALEAGLAQAPRELPRPERLLVVTTTLLWPLFKTGNRRLAGQRPSSRLQ